MNYYQILNVPFNAKVDQIRESFSKLTKMYHPDRYAKIPNEEIKELLEELFQIIFTAYRTLSNLEERRLYDKELRRTSLIINSSIEEIERKRREKEKKEKVKTEDTAKINITPGKKQPVVSATSTTQENSSSAYDVNPYDTQIDDKILLKQLKMFSIGTKRKKSKKERAKELFEEAMEKFKKRNYKEAESLILKALRGDSMNKEYYFQLAKVQMKMGGRHLNDAELNLKRAIQLDNENAQYYFHLGKVYEMKNDRVKANQFYKLAIAWDPENKEIKEAFKKFKESEKKGLLSKFFKKKN